MDGLDAWIVRAVPDGLWIIDDAGLTTYANDHLARMLGRSPAEMIGFPAEEALDEAGRSDFRAHLERLRESRAPGNDLACLLIRADGTNVWVLASHTPLIDEDGQLRGWLHRVREYGEERRMLDELQRRGVQLAEAQATALIGSWERETSDNVLHWSDELFRVFGVDRETFQPSVEAFIEHLHPDERSAAVAAYSALIESGDEIDRDTRLASPPGQRTRWVRTRGRIVRDATGAVVRLSGTVQDITESKEAELGLGFLTAMAGTANESRTLSDALLSARTTVRPFSPWPAVVVGIPDPGDERVLVHLPAGWADYDEDVLRAAEDLATRAAAEGRLVHGPGPAPLGIHLVAGPAMVRDRVACVVVSDTGVTAEPRPFEVAIFTQMLVFLAHVAEREEAANRLGDARDEALAASRAKSEFLATMSHEIRTPLNGVIGLSELLSRTELSAHQRRLAEGVDQAGRSLLSLVNDILDLSKIEAGRLDLEELDFDPRSIVEQSVDIVAEAASAKGLELVVASSEAMPSTVRGDPVRFGQVITNLVANAVKFTKVGEVVVRASSDASGVRVEVRDTGIGIAADTQRQLFTAFSQADSSTTREYGGTGLGLAISKRIVDATGGAIGVSSEPGAGSTFWFVTPFASAHSTLASSEAELQGAVAGLHVLVVDDNETNRFILREQLEAWQVRVSVVESAYDALVELDASVRHHQPYDVVLLDYMMPGADGDQLARIIRAEERHRDTRLALLSSAVEPSAEWLAAAGLDAFLSKPVLPSRLLDSLATLGGRRAERLVAPVPTPVGSAPTPVHGRVLVVEDNEVNQLVAEGVLRRLGYDVMIAENGAAGVAALADEPDGYDAILMDCQMPVMDGYDATRAIRAMRGGDDIQIPVIAMTAAATAEERERCQEAGMDDFLTKPVVPALLEATLSRWIS